MPHDGSLNRNVFDCNTPFVCNIILRNGMNQNEIEKKVSPRKIETATVLPRKTKNLASVFRALLQNFMYVLEYSCICLLII